MSAMAIAPMKDERRAFSPCDCHCDSIQMVMRQSESMEIVWFVSVDLRSRGIEREGNNAIDFLESIERNEGTNDRLPL